MTTDLILGTAGHIDHGKTSLVCALTGVDTDRLPEEKRRGITIELGFAQLDLARTGWESSTCRGTNDLCAICWPAPPEWTWRCWSSPRTIRSNRRPRAPGNPAAAESGDRRDRHHQGRFGRPGLDRTGRRRSSLVDDGNFLGRRAAGTHQRNHGAGAGRPARGSGCRGRASCTVAADGDDQAPFRMAIDRSFTIAGYGTVVTGSVSSGRVRLGDELVIEPGAVNVRVRGLQHHDQPVDEVHRASVPRSIWLASITKRSGEVKSWPRPAT